MNLPNTINKICLYTELTKCRPLEILYCSLAIVTNCNLSYSVPYRSEKILLLIKNLQKASRRLNCIRLRSTLPSLSESNWEKMLLVYSPAQPYPQQKKYIFEYLAV